VLTRVRELETELATVRQQMKSVTIGDAVVNLEQSYRSRVAYLEHALAQAQQTIRLQESRLSAPSPARELLEAEKKQLLVRCYDLEATVTRQQMRIKSLEEQHAGHSRTSTPDEGLKLMEILCTTNARLSDRPEFKDLARQLTEGIELLGAIHTISPIPTLGHPLVDDLHRVARVFFSTLLDDNTIVYEAAKGYRIGDRVYQKSVVWSVKQKFSCPACKMLARPQDNFCLKCGQEITASDGTPRRKLAPLPAEVEVFLPLVDTLTMQGQFDKAARLLDYLTQERPDHPAAEQRRRQLEKLHPRTEPQPE